MIVFIKHDNFVHQAITKGSELMKSSQRIKNFIDNLSSKQRDYKKSEYIGAIVVNIILLYIFNNLVNWHIYFITGAFNEVLWIINLAVIAVIIGNILLLIFNPEWFRHIVKIILNIFVITAVYSIYSIFPFNFSSFLTDWSVTIALIFVMIGIVIATIVELFLLIISVLARSN